MKGKRSGSSSGGRSKRYPQVYKDVLVVGIGNPLRSDDGVGPYVADCIEAKGFPQVTVWITQQLCLEDLEPMLAFRRIILIDAAVEGEGISFRLVTDSPEHVLASSHHLSAEVFVRLARSIYHKDIFLELCSIRGDCFEVGQQMSKAALALAKKAVVMICNSLMKKEAEHA